TGKDTLHDTVGIMYQNINLKDYNVEEEEEKEYNEGCKRDRRRRRLISSYHSALKNSKNE
ncbi:hypothetical protein J6590_059590, partial [Homalodisca vitripennis]